MLTLSFSTEHSHYDVVPFDINKHYGNEKVVTGKEGKKIGCKTENYLFFGPGTRGEKNSRKVVKRFLITYCALKQDGQTGEHIDQKRAKHVKIRGQGSVQGSKIYLYTRLYGTCLNVIYNISTSLVGV